MIAPLQTDPKPRSNVSRRLMAARAVVAATLLSSTRRPASIASWKAWLVVAWVVLTLTVYGLSLSGLTARFLG
ncbi:MAG TPA: hypothetical protein VHC22_12530 [Pirellulales bacterium]|nr:hypothetical protein [Pirellulales bacterium]